MSEPQTEPNKGAQNDEPTVEELQQQLEAKEQDISYLKGKWGEEKSELMANLKSLNDRQAETDGRIKEQRELFDRKNVEPTADPFELDEETMDEIRDDPTKLVAFMQKRQSEDRNTVISTILDALKQRDAQNDERFNEFSGTVKSQFKELDPELQQWKPSIDELKERNPAFKDLDESILIAIAKEKDMKPSMEYRGQSGGQRHRESSESKRRVFDPASNDTAVQIAMYMAKGDTKHAEKLWNDAEAKAGRL